MPLTLNEALVFQRLLKEDARAAQEAESNDGSGFGSGYSKGYEAGLHYAIAVLTGVTGVPTSVSAGGVHAWLADIEESVKSVLVTEVA